MKPVQLRSTVRYDSLSRERTVAVAGAARAGSAAATGSAQAVARASEAFLVVSDLDHAKTLQNCPEAAQYVLTRFVHK